MDDDSTLHIPPVSSAIVVAPCDPDVFSPDAVSRVINRKPDDPRVVIPFPPDGDNTYGVS